MEAMLRLNGVLFAGNNALLRAVIQAGAAADARIGDTIALFLSLRLPNRINLTKMGFTSKLKYSMVKSRSSKMMPIFRVSPG